MNEARAKEHAENSVGSGIIDSLVDDLRNIFGVCDVHRAIDIGRLVIDRLYHGDLKYWRYRGRKDISFRRLQHHPRLPFSASYLSRAVSVYMLSERRPDLTQLRNLGMSHLQEVVCLSPEVQDLVIDQAEREAWSVKRVRSEVSELRRDQQGARRSRPPVIRILKQFDSWVESGAFLLEAEAIRDLETGEVRKLLAIARALCREADQLTRKLSCRVTECMCRTQVTPVTSVAASQH